MAHGAYLIAAGKDNNVYATLITTRREREQVYYSIVGWFMYANKLCLRLMSYRIPTGGLSEYLGYSRIFWLGEYCDFSR